MHPAQKAATSRRRALRCWGSRGAVMVEYALVLMAIVVMSLGALQNLQDGSEDEVANEFDCVSERPPPPSCQKRAVTTTTTTTIDATTTTSLPVEETTTTTTTTTTTLPGPVGPTTAAWDTPARGTWGFFVWNATAKLTLTSASGPVGGAQLKLAVLGQSGSELTTIDCTTGADGTCVVLITASALSPSVSLRVKSISSPPGAGLPTEIGGPIQRP